MTLHSEGQWAPLLAAARACADGAAEIIEVYPARVLCVEEFKALALAVAAVNPRVALEYQRHEGPPDGTGVIRLRRLEFDSNPPPFLEGHPLPLAALF